MAVIRGYTEDDVDVLSEELATLIQTSLENTLRRTAQHISTTALTAASSAALGPSDVAISTTYWQEEVDGVLVPYVGEVYQGSATSVAVGLADAFPSEELAGIPLIPDDEQLAFMKSVTGDFVNVGADVWEDVRGVLVDGVKNGESIEQIAAKIQSVSELTKQKATTVARTAVHSSAESGSYAQMKFLGYADDEVDKEWLSVHDERTRPTHVGADKQKVPLHGKFVVGGSHLDFPGDPLGAYQEIVHCRCTALFDVHEAPKFRCTSALVADASSASSCVMPIPAADISGIPWATKQAIIDSFKQTKVTPAYSGAAIHKSIAEVRSQFDTYSPGELDAITDWQILKLMDTQLTGASKVTYSEKYAAWSQSAAGKKVIGVTPKLPQATHVIAPITPAPPPAAATHLPTLPPIPGAPAAKDLEFTGKKFSSASGAEVWRNKTTGELWLFKPVSKSGSYTNKFLLKIEPALARVQSKALLMRPAAYEISDLGGRQGTLQYMFKSSAAWPDGTKFDPLKLSPEDLLVMQREQIFDWMVSNWDTHTGQWIRLEDGTLYGIDKGQAFKFFPNDKLDWDYVPVTPLGNDRLTYSQIWKSYIKGKNVPLQDPTTGELGAYIDQLMAIPDAEYRKLLEPYVVERVKAFGGDAHKLLDQMVARKNSLKADFAKYWAKAQAERAKVVAAVTPTPAAPVAAPVVTPVASPVTVGGNLKTMTWAQKKGAAELWTAVGGGKKVTPGWGGSKLYKVLRDFQKHPSNNYGLTDLEVLQMMDIVESKTGAAKTYESVVTDWLASPQSAKIVAQVGNPDATLTDAYKAKLGLAPGPKKVVAPAAAVSDVDTYLADIATPNLDNVHPSQLFSEYKTYKPGETMGYITTGNGDVLRMTAEPNGVSVSVLKTTPQGKVFVHDKFFDNSYDIQHEYNITPGGKWLQIPSKAPKPSKIPGKLPGDIVSTADIQKSQYLWSDGDIVAEGVTNFIGGDKYQLQSNGLGGFKLVLVPGSGHTPMVVKVYESSKVLPKSLSGVSKWQLTGDVLKTDIKSSLIYGKNVGDVVQPSDLFHGVVAPKFKAIAYAYDPSTNQELRISHVFSGVRLESRTGGTGTIWHEEMTFKNNEFPQFEQMTQSYTWRVATNLGDMPDEVKALIPGKGVAGKVPAFIQGKFVGEPVTNNEIWDSQYQSPTPGTVIAKGKSTQTGYEYRVVYQTDDLLHIEFRVSGSPDWTDVGTAADSTEFPSSVNWLATHESSAPMKVAPVSVKHVSTIVGQDAGDIVTPDEIYNGAPASGGLSQTLAYAYNAAGDEELKITNGNGVGVIHVWSRQAGSNGVWNHEDPYTTAAGANFHLKKYTWYAADEHGDMPLAYKQSIPTKPKTSSVIPAVNAGDVVSVDDLFFGVQNANDNVIIAYAYDGKTGIEYQLRVDKYNNGLKMMSRPTGTSQWAYADTITNSILSNNTHKIAGFKWYATDVSGQIPDELTAIIPKSFTPPPPPPAPTASVGKSTILNTDAGDVVTPEKIFTSAPKITHGKPAILAYAYNAPAKEELRITTMYSGAIRVWTRKYGTTTWKMENEYSNVTAAKLNLQKYTWYAADAQGVEPVEYTSTLPAAKKAAKAAAKKAAAIAPPTGVPLGGTSTHIPGKSVGDDVTKEEIFNNAADYEDGVVIAYSPKINAWNHQKRIFKADGVLVWQQQNASGSWQTKGIVKTIWDVPYGKWNASNDHVTPVHLKAAKKAVAKKVAPVAAKKSASPVGKVSSTPQPVKPFNMRHIDLTPWNDTEREEIYQYFRTNGGSIYVSTNPEMIWSKVQAIKSHFQTTKGGKYLQLNEYEILRIVDERSALKHGVTDTHPFESKIYHWMKTPAGKAWVNKRIDAPLATHEIPAPMDDWASSGIPMDKQKYPYVSAAESLRNREDSHARYGGWRTGEKAALKEYTGGSFHSWNDAIRRGDISAYRAKILAAQKGMRPSVRAMTLHRRVGFSELNDPSITSYETLLPYVGRTYVNRGFNSTSFGPHGTWSGQLHIEIQCPIGTPMSHAADYSHFKQENEVTLPAHLIYEIISVKKEAGGTTLMVVRVIGSAQP